MNVQDKMFHPAEFWSVTLDPEAPLGEVVEVRSPAPFLKMLYENFCWRFRMKWIDWLWTRLIMITWA